ncbi:3-deoxy-manno-octulosonate cytidylyltransferase [Psychroflexus montanilacus]|uniref:3-deoxy-manno-octulosonate cytidylyltransferase n=1 Tax=Psychroflexus montanilacus TaxID=2873598 RepID=UPI001CCB3658|nr:3-deoxy-manno-octulosonate cytidylyltransferase [Psychroflexus montanilacus]MBZ9651776.1 3-deoxy-manno-octulosonate cytidylyltransferase [Psychroflexus montanilacus]
MSKPFKVIAMIPARYEASRFPGKLMQDLAGKPVIVRTYEAARSTQLFDEVYVVTDSKIIFSEIEKHGGQAIMSQKEHECGSDRIAEAVQDMNVDIVINVQGDEPFINKKALSQLLNVFETDKEKHIDLASLKVKLTTEQDIINPNHVKVITDLNNFALYFSRSAIPFHRAKEFDVDYFKHVGIYAFRKEALMAFYNLPMSPLEAAEKIECIRYLENGKTIKMVETQEVSIGIDTPEDLEKARLRFS